jgi:ABC-2 type transport system permease protein
VSVHVASRAFTDRRRGLLWWILGSVAYSLMIVATFPTVRDQEEINELIAEYPPELMALFAGGETSFDLTSAADYLNSQIFALFLPIILVILAIGFGAGTIAGEEEKGTLDLLLSYPVTRRQVLLEKAAVLGALVTIVAIANYGASFVVGRIFDIEVPLTNIVVSALAQILLGSAIGLLALAVGAFSGSRGLAIAVGTGVAGASYLIGSLAPVVSWLEPLRYVSPFFYATGANPLANGLPAWHLGVLVALVAALLAAAMVGFERRDLRR